MPACSPLRAPCLATAALSVTLLGACGGSSRASATARSASASATARRSTTPVAVAAPPAPARAASPGALLDWPRFGLDAQRTSATDASTGITAANVGLLRQRRVALPGTVDSAPVYLHQATVAGAPHDAIVVTTSYGRTLAIDAASGATLWSFAPSAATRLEGTRQITVASPIVDRDRRWVYAASPDGAVHKLSLQSGSEDTNGSWPVRVTLDPTTEKITSPLAIDGASLIVTTGGYFGDAPPYQGHILSIERASGRVRAAFNSLCANRRALIPPGSCAASGSAMWGRGGPLVEPGSGRLLVSTGNGDYDGRTSFGDSVIQLDPATLHVLQAYTPSNQAQLSASDLDLGSSGPAALGGGLVVQGGKDGILRLLDERRLDGALPSQPRRQGGELQKLGTPGGDQLFSQPAVWHPGPHAEMFVATSSGTGAYALHGRRLRPLWQNRTPGTSPVLAGGLLYVYDPQGGGVKVYSPRSPRPLVSLPCPSGHWNSPIVVDRHVIVPEGNANDQLRGGTLDIFTAP